MHFLGVLALVVVALGAINSTYVSGQQYQWRVTGNAEIAAVSYVDFEDVAMVDDIYNNTVETPALAAVAIDGIVPGRSLLAGCTTVYPDMRSVSAGGMVVISFNALNAIGFDISQTDGSTFSVQVINPEGTQVVGFSPNYWTTSYTCVQQPVIKFSDCPGQWQLQIKCNNIYYDCPLNYHIQAQTDTSTCAYPPPSPGAVVPPPPPSGQYSEIQFENDDIAAPTPTPTTTSLSSPPPPPLPSTSTSDNCGCACCTGWDCELVATGTYLASSASDCTEKGCVEHYPDSCATTGSHKIAVVYSERKATNDAAVSNTTSSEAMVPAVKATQTLFDYTIATFTSAEQALFVRMVEANLLTISGPVLVTINSIRAPGSVVVATTTAFLNGQESSAAAYIDAMKTNPAAVFGDKYAGFVDNDSLVSTTASNPNRSGALPTTLRLAAVCGAISFVFVSVLA